MIIEIIHIFFRDIYRRHCRIIIICHTYIICPHSSIYYYRYNKIRSGHRMTYKSIACIGIKSHNITDSQCTLLLCDILSTYTTVV